MWADMNKTWLVTTNAATEWKIISCMILERSLPRKVPQLQQSGNSISVDTPEVQQGYYWIV